MKRKTSPPKSSGTDVPDTYPDSTNDPHKTVPKDKRKDMDGR
jgi:hypothetical protein